MCWLPVFLQKKWLLKQKGWGIMTKIYTYIHLSYNKKQIEGMAMHNSWLMLGSVVDLSLERKKERGSFKDSHPHLKILKIQSIEQVNLLMRWRQCRPRTDGCWPPWRSLPHTESRGWQPGSRFKIFYLGIYMCKTFLLETLSLTQWLSDCTFPTGRHVIEILLDSWYVILILTKKWYANFAKKTHRTSEYFLIYFHSFIWYIFSEQIYIYKLLL